MFGKLETLLKISYYKIKYGSNFAIDGMVRLSGTTAVKIKKGKICFGKKLNAEDTLFDCVGGRITIGDKVFFNKNCMVVSRGQIDVGEGCCFGPNCCLYDHDHQFDKNNGINQKEYNVDEILIGKNCWFGANVIVLKGTNIGDGCIIGAGTLLKGNIPAHSVVYGKQYLEVRPIHD